MEHLIAVIGYSDSGKTTLVTALVAEFKRRGYRVGTVKHTCHAPSFDKSGKDSWRHFDAGADTSMIYSDSIFAFVKRRAESGEADGGIHGLGQYFEDVDLVIAEGFKSAACPKIEVCRTGDRERLLYRRLPGVIAVVSPDDGNFSVPRFDWDCVPELAAMLEKKVLGK
ncbi:MAG: molybdopterin-guanine dinucleotide biosynthesis protein B [Desulfosalsimonadaceae bacterium]